jgi:CheY-like chemotaxis protein
MKTLDRSSESRTYPQSNNALKGIIAIGCICSIAGMISSLYFHDTVSLLFFAVLFLGFCLSFVLYRNDLLLASTMLSLSLLVITAGGSMMTGMTDRSIAFMVLPVVLFFSAIQFHSRPFIIFSAGLFVLMNAALIVSWHPVQSLLLGAGGIVLLNFILLSVAAVGRLLYHERSAAPESMTAPVHPVSPRSYKGTILIVDDNEKILDILDKSLNAEGYKVFPFSSVLALTEWIQNPPERFDLLITDYFLNESDGRIVIEQVRKILPAVPIILISGYPLNKLSFDSEYYRNVTFMQKPFSAQDIIETIERMIQS